ncbi:HtaA domain-containing protein [Streptomyces sp. NPDC041068]|uniref:HtaA domain-containing protein n=1 Tax=Streptomyces sp. NPDC041068 TaxID=3155130 RepID=UPI003411B1E9
MAPTRRPITLAAAVATAVALGASALALPALAADGGKPAAPPKLELKDGALQWGVKESFRKYVVGMAHGRIEARDGARQAADNGVFTFTGGKGTYDTGVHATDVAFKGNVRFSSTAHRFDIKIADVKVHTKGKTGAIQADVTLNGAVQNDIDLAELDLSAVGGGQGEGGAIVYKDIPATLTADGAKAFNGMYKEGEKLDPATLAVTPGAPVTEKPTESPKPTEPTESGKPTESAEPTESAKPTQGPTESTKPTGRPTGRPTGTPGGGQSADRIVEGSLSWGLKKSFRTYISTGGEVTVAGGAKKISSGYRFPHGKADVNSGAKKIDASFGGSVRFTYKAHGIDMKFSDIKVRANGAKGTLLVDVTTPKGTNNDVKFATLDLSKTSYKAKGGVVLLDKVPAAFTADGAKQFANGAVGSMYKAGQKIDPVTVALSSSAGADLPAGGGEVGTEVTGGTTGSGSVGGGGATVGGSGSLASTGASVPSTALLGTAGAAMAAGAAAVVVARRRRGTEVA